MTQKPRDNRHNHYYYVEIRCKSTPIRKLPLNYSSVANGTSFY